MLIDNKKDRYQDGRNIVTVWDFINEFAGKKSNQTGDMDIVTGYFTIRALAKLYDEIPEEDNYRIVSSEMVKQDGDDNQIIDILNGDRSIESQVLIDEDAKKAKAFLERNNVQIKAIVDAFCHAKAYMFKNKNPRENHFYLTGSSNLTDAGLGLKASSNVELTMGNASSVNDNDYNEVCSWFEDIWKQAKETVLSDPNDKKSPKISVKEYFIRKIDEYFKKYTPEQIYYKILFELFNSDIELDASIEHRQDMSMLQDSVIWKTLFNYQQKGVISLIKMLRKYNGAILADAVGLGKTFSALAVIKYFQTQNYLTVLLCPKKLEENWTQYLRRHNSRFEKDEFDYVVRFHTDMQHDRLEDAYNDTKLSYLQSRKKILVVIDESHNLRNEKSNRYQELLTKLIQNQEGQETRDVKVLMLSATPINTGLNDVKGQFNLIGRGEDKAFDTSEFGVESLRNVFADAQRKYTQWCKDPNRTIGSFIAQLPPKFFNLTDKLIVARTRKLIEKTLGEDLGFPNKEKPINVYQGVDHFGKLSTTDDIYAAFDALSLTAYQPSLFIPESRKKAEKGASKDWDDDVNRERFLVKMMGILFMKRLESSWFSCLTTVKKVLDVHESTLQLVLDYEAKKGKGAYKIGGDGITDEDEELDDMFALRKGTIKLSEMKNLGGFKRGLQEDVNKLKAICNNLLDFQKKYEEKKEKDLKLEELIKILNNKKEEKNKKVVIFTAYADTARFIYEELTSRGFTNIASASGQEILTTGHQSTKNFTEVLQCFAPYSKLYKELDWKDLYEDAELNRATYYDDENKKWNVDYEKWKQLIKQYQPKYQAKLDDNIDILIATDCLSEGQNLQDADMQINYDIHWNPVRLIQRFGRIDRIGSPNKVIRCVNFWPAKSFEDYLHLEKRIQDRMTLMKLVDTETTEIDEKFTKMVEDNPIQDKNADRLLEELSKNSISDIESPRTLSLKDFSFEVYRQDLIDYFEKNKEVFRKMPNGIFSGFKMGETLFDHPTDSLVAVVGYPKRTEGSTKPYTELYLMCQPADGKLPADFQEINRAEILELLRKNKYEDRFVPEWISENNTERLSRLSEILKQWMEQKAPRVAVNNIKDKLRRRIISTPANKKKDQLQEEKFRIENFDLIVWEYITNA